MKKVLILTICFVLIVSSLTLAVACDNNDKAGSVREVDMSLRTDTKYGLYWYGDSGELDDAVISAENLPTQYYDPSKPTLIYSHGWKPAGEDKETLSTLAKTYSKTGGDSGNVNYVKELKELGYNVAFWDWHDYAKDLDMLHNEIWVVRSAENIEDKDSNYYAAVSALDGRSFAGELVRSMCAVMKDATDQEVVLVGHSFGGQMVTAAAYTLYKLAEEGVIINKNILPDRVSLADPYMTGVNMSGQMDMLEESISSQPVAKKAADSFEYVNSQGAVIDFNGAMNTITYNAYEGITGIKDKELRAQVTEKIKNNTVYILQKCLTRAYGGMGDVHNVSRDYVLTCFIEGKKGNITAVPNVSMTASELKAYVGRQFDLNGEGFLIEEYSATEVVAD